MLQWRRCARTELHTMPVLQQKADNVAVLQMSACQIEMCFKTDENYLFPTADALIRNIKLYATISTVILRKFLSIELRRGFEIH